MLAGVGNAEVASGMLEIDTERVRSKHQSALDEILVFAVGGQIKVPAWVRPERQGGLHQHIPEWRVVIEDVQNPEAQLVVASRFLIDHGRGADFNHGHSVQQSMDRGKAKLVARV